MVQGRFRVPAPSGVLYRWKVQENPRSKEKKTKNKKKLNTFYKDPRPHAIQYSVAHLYLMSSADELVGNVYRQGGSGELDADIASWLSILPHRR